MELLATKELLSKSQAKKLLQDHHYPEIHQSFKGLSERGLIEIARGPFQVKRGKREIFYTLSEQGARALVEVTEDTIRFGNILIGYCLSNQRKIGDNEVKELFRSYMGKYLEYPTIPYAYLLSLDPVNDMCSKWIKDYGPSSNGITVAQKVLEVLAYSPNITLHELVQKTGNTRAELEEVLGKFVFDGSLVNMILAQPLQRSDLLVHCMIVQEPNKNRVQHYRLSLVGVLAVLTLFGDARGSLFHKDLSVKEYYARLAANYSDLLPKIFGKWKLLTQISDVMPIVSLDVILDKDIRFDLRKRPLALGGNREYSFAMESVILQNKGRIQNIEQPIVRLLNQANPYHGPRDRERLNKLGPIVDLLMITKHTLDPYYLNNQAIWAGNMKVFESILGNEISFLYYLRFRNYDEFLKDHELAEWFSARLRDIKHYFHETTISIENLSRGSQSSV